MCQKSVKHKYHNALVKFKNKLKKIITMDRRTRGLTENIYLVKFESDNNNLIFHVLGSSKYVYNIIFKIGMKPTCSCPDHKIRKKICKHIFFVAEKVMHFDVEEWSQTTDIQSAKHLVLSLLPHLADENITANSYYTKQYENITQNISSNKSSNTSSNTSSNKIEIRNDDCCICLCPIDTNNPKNLIICNTCKNGIHNICWEKWNHVNANKKCVYCRTKLIFPNNLNRGILLS